jgi:hypothetical protein
LLWDLAEARKGLTVPKGDIDPAGCWNDLLGEDAAKAYTAIDRLAAHPDKALPLLRERVQPETVDARWLRARLADLDSDDFATRQTATKELTRVAETVESDLRRELAKTSSAEVRRRLQGVLEALRAARVEVPAAELVRRLRAVVILERLGSEEARAVLRELADGAPDARLTRDAKAALARLTPR